MLLQVCAQSANGQQSVRKLEQVESMVSHPPPPSPPPSTPTPTPTPPPCDPPLQIAEPTLDQHSLPENSQQPIPSHSVGP